MAFAFSSPGLPVPVPSALRSLRAFEAAPRVRGAAPGLAALEELLPDQGYPHGVIELMAPGRLGGGTSLALAAIAALHAADAHAHAAWIDSEGSLYAPGVAALGVDLARLLVVRPPWERMTETAVKVAVSSAFSLIVVDVDPRAPLSGRHSGRRPLGARGELFVRKLQLAAEAAQASVLLLTDAHAGRASLPTSLRLSLERRKHSLWVRVEKDRHGRVGAHTSIPLSQLGGPLSG